MVQNRIYRRYLGKRLPTQNAAGIAAIDLRRWFRIETSKTHATISLETVRLGLLGVGAGRKARALPWTRWAGPRPSLIKVQIEGAATTAAITKASRSIPEKLVPPKHRPTVKSFLVLFFKKEHFFCVPCVEEAEPLPPDLPALF
jgi:hypothetical protein